MGIKTIYQQPRETMRVLPTFLQPFLTWMTGCPLTEEKPLIYWSPMLAAILGLILIALGVSISYLSLNMTWWLAQPLLLLSWLITTSGMRRLDVLIVHQSLHNKVTKSRLGNRIASEAITTFLWRSPYDINKKEHMDHHKYPCTDSDVDISYLKSTGLKPGMSRMEFKWYVLKTLLSPSHHFRFFWSRIKSNLFSNAPLYRLAMAWIYLAVLVGVLSLTDMWTQWFIVWFIPVVFFFQNSTYLYTMTEHRWMLHDYEESCDTVNVDLLTFGRFCGDPVPITEGLTKFKKLVLWLRWWFRVCFFHAPYRFCILVGDTVQHDLHHIQPGCDWANSAYVRRDNVMAGLQISNEVWGTLLDHLYSAAGVNDSY